MRMGMGVSSWVTNRGASMRRVKSPTFATGGSKAATTELIAITPSQTHLRITGTAFPFCCSPLYFDAASKHGLVLGSNSGVVFEIWVPKRALTVQRC